MNELLADPEVSRQKLRREMNAWRADPIRDERGWVLLNYDETTLTVEIAFLAKLAISVGSSFLPVVACAIRLTYDNYDLFPPSLLFIDAFTRKPARPHVSAILQTPEGPRNVLIDSHPDTRLPFLCVPGVREYHSHPQHSGDDWLLHRQTRAGTLSTICERIWRLMIKNVVGLHVGIQTLPSWPLRAQLQLQLVQGEVSQSAMPPAPDTPEAQRQAFPKVA